MQINHSEEIMKLHLDDEDIILSVKDKQDHLYLDLIHISKDKRGQGLGTLAMTNLCAYVDSVDMILTLFISTEYGCTLNRLKEFYGRFGFTRMPDGLHYEGIYIRYPNS